ncbi:hypothetical protein [Acinetobacter pittii]|uniref:hypothetical protein n=1 Tax=Acinetobacter pittii TaxID=48296 RepID=UPI001EE5A2E2|nr:hypothetical protein [Acinetobacter pittii]MCG5226055.1 hypothetical protein [Acinetobacter pittii]
MLKDLEILEIPQFKNGDVSGYKKGLSFILNGFHFSFYSDEAKFFEFYPSEDHCKIQYRAMCFTLSKADAISLQEKMEKLKE